MLDHNLHFDPAITPNQGGSPSELWNNPQFAPLVGRPDGFVDFSKVPGDAGVYPRDAGGTNITPQGAINDLMALRARFPHLPIMPIPPEAAAIVLAVANTAVDMIVPDGAVLAVFDASATTFMCRNGNADVPTVALTAMGTGQTRSFILNPNRYWYVGGIHSLSFASATAGAIVTGMFYAPDQLPR